MFCRSKGRTVLHETLSHAPAVECRTRI
jgi:hypothetical protein